jgi:hypothetical protein
MHRHPAHEIAWTIVTSGRCGSAIQSRMKDPSEEVAAALVTSARRGPE